MSRASPDLLLVDLACSVCSSADGIGPTSAGKRRYDISLIQTEQVRSINTDLYDSSLISSTEVQNHVLPKPNCSYIARQDYLHNTEVYLPEAHITRPNKCGQ